MNSRIYLDNASTTPVATEVLEAMLPWFSDHFGNPSSAHYYGRLARMAVETARKQIGGILDARPSEIYFTGSGTESNNTAINTAIRDLGCLHIITSPTEHHAVLNTVKQFTGTGKVTRSFVKITSHGHIDMADLDRQLSRRQSRCLVSLMHGNNEIGNLTDLEAAGVICRKYNAIFHSDCVQTLGHYPIALNKLSADFITGSAHKFHGPKGTGLLFIRDGVPARAFITGGGQERNMRAGTENVSGIIGLKEALSLAHSNHEAYSSHITVLKTHMIRQLREKIRRVQFNGDYSDRSLYTLLNVSFPKK